MSKINASNRFAGNFVNALILYVEFGSKNSLDGFLSGDPEFKRKSRLGIQMSIFCYQKCANERTIYFLPRSPSGQHRL